MKRLKTVLEIPCPNESKEGRKKIKVNTEREKVGGIQKNHGDPKRKERSNKPRAKPPLEGSFSLRVQANKEPSLTLLDYSRTHQILQEVGKKQMEWQNRKGWTGK